MRRRVCKCGSDETWVPTYCNFAHCALCFGAIDPEHDECQWNGSEHESYGPSSKLPGNVYINGEDYEDLSEEALWRSGF